jgi:uncharacterized membrane protein YqjE
MINSSRDPSTTGFFASVRTFGDNLLATAQSRLELLSTELHEEKFRLIQTFIWISAIVFTGTMAVAFASITLVYVFWESARLTVLGGLTAGYAGALVWIVVAFRRYLARQPRPFAATLGELQQDRACIQPES